MLQGLIWHVRLARPDLDSMGGGPHVAPFSPISTRSFAVTWRVWPLITFRTRTGPPAAATCSCAHRVNCIWRAWEVAVALDAVPLADSAAVRPVPEACTAVDAHAATTGRPSAAVAIRSLRL
jgi:hypothetical protein